MKKIKVYMVDYFGNRYFETITTVDNHRKVLDEVCDKAKSENLYLHAKSEFV